MHPAKPRTPHSRWLAPTTARWLHFLAWTSILSHCLVFADGLGSTVPRDALLDHRLADTGRSEGDELAVGSMADVDRRSDHDTGYAPDFAYFDRSLIGRADEDVVSLGNNQISGQQCTPGDTKFFVFSHTSKRSVDVVVDGDRNLSTEEMLEETDADENESTGEKKEFRKRQDQNQVFISASTCSQPGVTGINTDMPPQLKLYISTSSDNQKPGPDSMDNLAADPIEFVGGFANFSMNTSSDVYIGVEAPAATKGWTGGFSFEIAASVDRYYHSYDESTPFLFIMDTDYQSALFITQNITTSDDDTENVDKWMSLEHNPFTMYVFPDNHTVVGLDRSFCGLKQYFANITANATDPTKRITVDTSMTTRYGGDLPKGQFHVQNLDKDTVYAGYLVMDGAINLEGATTDNHELSNVGLGGRVWKSFNWTTKATDACQIIYNLDFCTGTAYAVPSSPKFQTNTSGLAALYDAQASAYFQNFTNSLDQVACSTTGSAQYSLARTCDDCSSSYRDWLCSVLMPRCLDFNTTIPPGLQPRNINAASSSGWIPYADNMTAAFNESTRFRRAFSQSRNPLIDSAIGPGPYKELLPCEDLCFDIVRSCPASLNFGCPEMPMRGLDYARRDDGGAKNLTCNFPGAVVDLNTFRSGAVRAGVRGVVVVGVVLVVLGVMGI